MIRGRRPLRRFFDRAFGLAVFGGGAGVAVAVLGILVFLGLETAPLFRGARLGPAEPWPLSGSVAGLSLDPYGPGGVVLRPDGHILRLRPGKSPKPLRRGPSGVESARPCAGGGFLFELGGGRFRVAPYRWEAPATGGRRGGRFVLEAGFAFETGIARPACVGAAVLAEGGAMLAVQAAAGGPVRLDRRSAVENPMTGERTVESRARRLVAAGTRLRLLSLDPDGFGLFGVGSEGRVLWWDLRHPGGAPAAAAALGAEPTAARLLAGGRTLVVGTRDGRILRVFPRGGGGRARLAVLELAPPGGEPIRRLAAAHRSRLFAAVDSAGRLRAYYATTGGLRWSGVLADSRPRLLVFGPRDRRLAVLRRTGGLFIHPFDCPHPEADFRAFFGRVFYEGAAAASYTWQSTGGSAGYEPKLSLVPLLFGSLKGTIFALVLSAPLGILGALYVAWFAGPRLRACVKPALELMAAVPSVILGFLAAVWFAPRFERGAPACFAMLVALPVAFAATGLAGAWLPRRIRARLPQGAGLAGYALAACLTFAAASAVGPSVESLLFGGDFPTWVRSRLGLPFEQRNAFVVAVAMAFAVVPVIFSIAEDAFSNVPQSLVSASLALGATRWRTMLGVVVPAAAPGLFSALMLGFGRAVGETMIVLMATGNTPIQSWNPFDGFRTLSANIAVEIPEAPVGGTLYRTLFLSALLLFALTFALNTAADLVRRRLGRNRGRS